MPPTTSLPDPAPARPFRSGRPDLQGVCHGPLQSAVHLHCMPAGACRGCPNRRMLTDEELLRIIGILVGLGVDTVRLTGGEPLLRRSLVDVVAGIAALDPRPGSP